MKRPTGITIISLFFGFNAFGVLYFTPHLLLGYVAILPQWFGYISLACGLSALFTCIGLWGMKSWSISALKAWMVASLIFGLTYDFYFGNSEQNGHIFDVGFAIFTGIFLLVLYQYVSSKIENVT